MPLRQQQGWHAVAWNGARAAEGVRAVPPLLSVHCRALSRACVCDRHLISTSRLDEDYPRRGDRHDNDCKQWGVRYDIIERGGSNRKKLCASFASSPILLSILRKSGSLWGKGAMLCNSGSVMFFAHRSIPAYSFTLSRICAEQCSSANPTSGLAPPVPGDNRNVRCSQQQLFTAAADWLLYRSVATGVISTTAAVTMHGHMGTHVQR